MTKTTKNGKKTGRPSSFTQKIADELCERISKGESVRTICKDKHMPNADTIYKWLLDEDKIPFSEQYAKARAAQAEHLFDEILDIADDGTNDYVERETKDGHTIVIGDHEHINRSRLRVDTRKWYLSKVLPKKYGEKIDITTGGERLSLPDDQYIQLIAAAAARDNNNPGST